MAATYVVLDPIIGQLAATATGTTPLAKVGGYYRGFDNGSGTTNMGAGQFVYARGSNVTAAGQFVHVSNGSAVLLASGNSNAWWPIGVAAGNLSATNVFGWVQVQGLCDYALVSNTSIATSAYICFGSTAGQVGSVTALGSRIAGIGIPTSFTSSQTSVTCYLDFPKAIGLTGSN